MLSWLDDLVAKGKAVKLNDNGYPTRYEARAADVLPLVESGNVAPPNNKHWNPMGEVKLQPKRIAVTSPDQVLAELEERNRQARAAAEIPPQVLAKTSESEPPEPGAVFT